MPLAGAFELVRALDPAGALGPVCLLLVSLADDPVLDT
jgi:hypothetical protein